MTLDQEAYDVVLKTARDETKRKILMDIIDLIDSDFNSRANSKVRRLRNRIKNMYEGTHNG
jgi:hypothetical protein